MDDREHSGRTAREGAWERGEIEKFLASAPIFYQPWWLEAVSPGNWDYAVVRQGSEIAAVMPFVYREIDRGPKAIGMPEMTHTLGPWLRLTETEYSRRLDEETELMMRLIDALPPYGHFLQNFHHSITNWLPFRWKGFSQTTGYTYILRNLGDLDAIWEGFDHDVRVNIRKVEKQVRVVEDLDIKTFNETRVKSFARQGRESTWSLDFIRRVDETLIARNARKIFAAVDANNQIHSVVYMVWTECAAYLIMGGGDPALRNSGANSLLIWEAIKSARKVARTLDFEMGAPTPEIEHFFRMFGAELVPYCCVSKDSRGILRKIRSVSLLLGRSLFGASMGQQMVSEYAETEGAFRKAFHQVRLRRYQLFELKSPEEIVPVRARVDVTFCRVDYTNVGRVAEFRKKEYVKIFRQYLDEGQCGVFAMIGSKVVGHGWAMVCRERSCGPHPHIRIRPGEAHIHFCQVLEPYRGKGIFAAMLAVLCKTLFEEVGVRRISSDTLANNIPSVRAHLRMGMRLTGQMLVLYVGKRMIFKMRVPQRSNFQETGTAGPRK